MRYIPFVIYLFILAFYEVILRQPTAILNVSVNMAALMVVAVAVYKSELTAAWFGFVVGVVLTAQQPDIVGWHSFVLSILGVVAWQIREKLNLDAFRAKMLLMFGGVLAHNVATLIISGTDAFFQRLVDVGLLGAVYTSLVAWLFFLVKEGRVTMAKFKALF